MGLLCSRKGGAARTESCICFTADTVQSGLVSFVSGQSQWKSYLKARLTLKNNCMA